MKLVVLDGYTLNPGDLTWDRLKDFGAVAVFDRTAPEDVAGRIKDATVVLTNKTRLSKAILEGAKALKFIAVLATGYDVVDTETAHDLGIVVSNVPTYGTHSVSQFAIALLLEVCNQVGRHNHSVHVGNWEKNPDWCYWETPLIELQDKTIGIVGYGRIGRTTAAIAKAMGMEVIAYDPHPSKETEFVSFKALCHRADVIALHCGLTPENYHMINKESLSWMKPTAILINNARGGLVNETDLAQALNEQVIFAAGLDVVSEEPISSSNPLLHAPNCYLTPHMSWGSLEARRRIMDETYRNIAAFAQHEPINTVN